jgi:ElaB/YqjD/DUF883 family membrane-anchored ribosome-binding protein
MPDTSAYPDQAAKAAAEIAAETAAQTERTLAELAKRVEKAVQESLAELRARSRDYADVAGEQFDIAQRYVVDQVQERPMTATLTALGIGVVLGALLVGRRR